MRKKALSWLLVLSLMLSLFVLTPITTSAAEVTQRYIYDSAVLPNGDIGVLFIYGGNSTSGIVSGGILYFGIYDPDTDDWTQEAINPGGGAPVGAKDTALALDSSGNPHVIYVTSDDNLGYTAWNGSSWDTAEIIDSIAFGGVDGALSSPDIAVDSSSYVHISYLDAKGGYEGGNDYSAYEKDDLVYANNTSGSFSKVVRSFSHGWFWSPDGWRNLVYAPVKLALTNDQYCIGAKQYQYNKWMGGQDHIYNYDLFFEATSLGYPIRAASTNSDLGFRLFEIDSDGSTIYSLFNKSSTLYVTGGVTEIPAATKAFSATSADMAISGANVYYAAINGTSLLFYQRGSFIEGLNTTNAILADHPRVSTVVTGGSQYMLYTGNDTEKSLFIASVPIGGGDLVQFQVPNKTPVSITGVTVSDKEYDGSTVVPGGTLTVTGATLDENDLLYTYSGTGGTTYPSSTQAPTDAGTYQLVISVPEENETYTGSSAPIAFTIDKKGVSLSGITADTRTYAPGNVNVALNAEFGILNGIIESDRSSVSFDTSSAAGIVATADAGNGKSVSVSGFALTGSKSGNYALSQPTGITVNILPAQLTAPSVELSADSDNGGLSVTVSDDSNSVGVSSYTVEIYKESVLKKTITEISKDSAQNIPLESGIIEPESSYTAKAKVKADSSGNYSDSVLGTESSTAIAQYVPLDFSDSAAFDVPSSQVDKAISAIDLSGSVTGGKAPYIYSATGLPGWLSIDPNTGVISGTPTAVAAAGGSATITVTDAQSSQKSITISYGIVEKGDALVFSGTTPTSTKTYGDTPFDISGLIYDGSSENVSYSYVSGPGSLSGTILTITGAGNIVVRATGTSDNYGTRTEDFTITVNKKPLTITPTDASNTKVYGGIEPSLAYNQVGLVEGDSLSGSILSRAAGENAGSYSISLASDVTTNNPNYNISLASGSHYFSITKKSIIIDGATINSKQYDGTNAIDLDDVTSVTFDGLENSEELVLNTDFEVTSALYADDIFAYTNKAATIQVALLNTEKANNYEFIGSNDVYTFALADITPATQIITASNQTLTVSHSLDLSTIATSNAIGAVLTYAIEGGSSSYATLSGSVLTGIAAGEVTININSAAVNVDNAGLNEYNAAVQKQIIVTVSDKLNADAEITFTDGNITYGQVYTPNPTTTLTGGTFSYLYQGTADDGTAYNNAAPPVKAGSYTVTATYENDTHIGSKTVALIIAPKSITIGGVTANSRAYNGTTTVDISGGTLNGIVGTDDVNPVVPLTGSIGDSNVGSNKSVTIATITLTGDDKDNYILSQPTGITVNITPKVITFSVDAVASQEYTGSQIVPNATVKDGGTTLTKDADYTISYGTNLNAGTGTITITGIGNYLGSSAGTTFEITKATYSGSDILGFKQVISHTAYQDLTYDLSTLSFPSGFTDKDFKSVTIENDLDGLLSGASLSGSAVTFDVASKVAGKTGELHVVVGSTNYNDYTVVITVETVDKTPVTVTGVTAQNKTYNASAIVPVGTPSNDGGYSGTYEYWYEGTGSTIYGSSAAPSNAGDYRLIVRIPATDPTYAGEQLVPFSILKATLTVKPQNMSIYTGESLPVPVVTYEGIKGSDTGPAVAQLFSGNLDMEIMDTDGITSLTSSGIVGSYTIKFTGSPVFNEADNYTISTASGILSITNRPSSGGGGSSLPPAPNQEAIVSGGSGSASVEVKTDSKTGSASVELSSAQLPSGKDVVVTMPKIEGMMNNIIGIPVPNLSDTNGNRFITLKTASGSIALPSDMLIGTDAPAGSKAQVSIGAAKQSDLPQVIQDKIGNRPIVSLSLSIDGKVVAWKNSNAPVRVSIPYTPTAAELMNPDKITAYYIDGSGNLIEMKDAKYDPVSKSVVFTTTHFSYYAVGYDSSSANAQFNDVQPGTWYYDAVTYIAEKGITTGTGNGKFSPKAVLTRGQFIVMLMRAYGIEPDASPVENFTDAGNTYYTNHLATAKRLGISEGIGNNLFAPKREITRQEMFTLLFNALNTIDQLPVGNSNKNVSDFTDASQISLWAQDAMTALVKAGVVGGNGDKLTPKATTTRAEMAQVLYNLLGK